MQWLKPNKLIESIYKIDFDRLSQQGFKYIILDLDDTLIPRTINEVYPSVLEFVEEIKSKGFKICIASNSRHPLRVKYIGDTLGVPYSSLALKPLPFAFDKALAKLNAKPEETLVIGDQLFTDILGGNLKGLYTIYVKPLTEETFLPRQLMRWVEQELINRWQEKN